MGGLAGLHSWGMTSMMLFMEGAVLCYERLVYYFERV